MYYRKYALASLLVSASVLAPAAPAHAGFLRGVVLGGAGGAVAAHLWDKYHNHKQSTYYTNTTPANTPAKSGGGIQDGGDVNSSGLPEHRSPEGYIYGGNQGQGFSKDRSIVVPDYPFLGKAPQNWDSSRKDSDNTYDDWSQDYALRHGEVKIASVNISQLREDNPASGRDIHTKMQVARVMLAKAYQTGNYQPPVWLTEEERNGIRNADEHIPGLIWRTRSEWIYELWTN